MSGLHLIADIGGTNTRLALAQDGEPIDIKSIPTTDITNLIETLGDYLSSCDGAPERFSIAAAGPVKGEPGNREIEWWGEAFAIREPDITAAFPGAKIDMMNDFAAQALALPHLGDGDLRQLGSAGTVKPSGAKVVLGPGTGLGVAALIKGGHGRHVPITGEGGHTDLAATTDEEALILRILRQQYGHVSPERVVSGPGLETLYLAILALKEQLFAEASASEIAELARSRDGIARHAIHMMSAWLGSVAGDMALTFGATGGVYIGGGVVPALGNLFDDAAFRERFEDKGRFAFYTGGIATFLITRDQPGLLGLARQ